MIFQINTSVRNQSCGSRNPSAQKERVVFRIEPQNFTHFACIDASFFREILAFYERHGKSLRDETTRVCWCRCPILPRAVRYLFSTSKWTAFRLLLIAGPVWLNANPECAVATVTMVVSIAMVIRSEIRMRSTVDRKWHAYPAPENSQPSFLPTNTVRTSCILTGCQKVDWLYFQFSDTAFKNYWSDGRQGSEERECHFTAIVRARVRIPLPMHLVRAINPSVGWSS